MLRTLALAAALVFSAAASPALAQSDGVGPAVGAPAPELKVKNTDGEIVGLPDIAGENGVALVFFRSASWCPFCKTQLVELKEAAAPLADRGWAIAGVSYDDPDVLAAFAADNELNFPLLSDDESATIIAYGLLNEKQRPGSRAYGVPHPAIVFVRADGVVVSMLREEGYRNRPQVTTVVSTADALQAVGG